MRLFTGRESRSGWFIKFIYQLLVGAVILFPLKVLFQSDLENNLFAVWLEFLTYLGLSIFSISQGIRRLHDLGKSGWWMFLVLIPGFGSLYLFYIFFFKDGDGKTNRFGAKPVDKYKLPF